MSRCTRPLLALRFAALLSLPPAALLFLSCCTAAGYAVGRAVDEAAPQQPVTLSCGMEHQKHPLVRVRMKDGRDVLGRIESVACPDTTLYLGTHSAGLPGYAAESTRVIPARDIARVTAPRRIFRLLGTVAGAGLDALMVVVLISYEGFEIPQD